MQVQLIGFDNIVHHIQPLALIKKYIHYFFKSNSCFSQPGGVIWRYRTQSEKAGLFFFFLPLVIQCEAFRAHPNFMENEADI